MSPKAVKLLSLNDGKGGELKELWVSGTVGLKETHTTSELFLGRSNNSVQNFKRRRSRQNQRSNYTSDGFSDDC